MPHLIFCSAGVAFLVRPSIDSFPVSSAGVAVIILEASKLDSQSCHLYMDWIFHSSRSPGRGGTAPTCTRRGFLSSKALDPVHNFCLQSEKSL